MLNYEDLLSKIYEEEKIEFVLESLGCHSIHVEQGGSLIVAGRPDGDNKRAIQVKNDYTLNSVIHTRDVSGNIYDVIQNIIGLKHMSECKEYLMNMCGYDENSSYEEPPLMWLNKIKRQRTHYDLNFEIESINDMILNQYLYGDIKQFNDDGVSTRALTKFKIGYDVMSRRITIPIYDIDGNLCGVKGRATNKEDADMYKFLYLYKCNQGKTWYNYHRVKEIKGLKEVKVFEAEKSIPQMDDLEIYDCLGAGSSKASKEQLHLLMKLDCDIVLCFDEGIDLEEYTKPYFDFFNGKRNIYVVYPDDETPEKASPSDCGLEMWERLYVNRIQLCKGE